jgi:hypothetical protein
MMDLKNVSTMHCLTGDLQSKSAERGDFEAMLG